MEYTSKSGIYLLTNLKNGKIYIGQAFNICKRLQIHKNSENSEAKYRTHPILFAIRKHKWVNFKVTILATYENIESKILDCIETYFIAKYDATNRYIGYNVCSIGNSRRGFKVSEETRKKISLAHTGKIRKRGYKLPPFSEERKRNMSLAHIGKKRTTPVTEEQRQKMSQSMSKYLHNHDHPFLGKKHSEKSKQKMRDKQKGIVTHSRAIKQIDPVTGEIIKIWTSIKEAARRLGKPKAYSGIGKAAKNYITPNGYVVTTALGFKWEYI